MTLRSIHEDYHTVTPYIITNNADKFIRFLKHAFGAKELSRTNSEDGLISHAEIKIGDSIVEISSAREDFHSTSCAFHLFVDDVDKTFTHAIEAGAISVMEPSKQLYGDREAFVMDPCGNQWYIANHEVELTHEERTKRDEEFIAEMSSL